MNTSIENYFTEGCGRCPLGGTPECKVHKWEDELKLLRNSILLNEELKEEVKWGMPCYSVNGKNVLMLCAFKDFVCLSFFKGILLNNNNNLLEAPGPNSQTVRLFKFKSCNDIFLHEKTINEYIQESISNEKAGLKVKLNKKTEAIPEELEVAFDNDPVLKNAFEALTPGRQRSYLIHFSQAKQSSTRNTRIQKCTPMILSGIGLNENYRKR